MFSHENGGTQGFQAFSGGRVIDGCGLLADGEI